MTVAHSAETICATYRDGYDLVQRIRAKRKARKLLRKDCPQGRDSIDELEQSLTKGDTSIKSQLDRDCARFGEAYATGDRQFSRDQSLLLNEY